MNICLEMSHTIYYRCWKNEKLKRFFLEVVGSRVGGILK